jgi:nucleotide-binding universal stress UspA family protein
MAKKDDSEITILSVSQSKEGVTQEEQYAEKLALLCQIHGIKYNKKTVISQSLENAIISEARTHDLVVMGASSEPTHMKIAFGSLQDRVARAVKKPVLVMRKVKREKPGQPQ